MCLVLLKIISHAGSAPSHEAKTKKEQEMDIDSLINHPEWLLLVLAPLFLLCMLAEYFIGQKQGRLPDNSSYKLSEVLCNFTLAGMHQLSDLLTGLLIVQLYLWLFGWHLMDIEMGVISFIVLMVLQDFF